MIDGGADALPDPIEINEALLDNLLEETREINFDALLDGSRQLTEMIDELWKRLNIQEMEMAEQASEQRETAEQSSPKKSKGKTTQQKKAHYTVRRVTVAEMYLQGKRQVDIAAACKVSQGTISNDLAALHEQWRESALVTYDAAKAVELARIDHMERVAWEEYEASKADRERTVQEQTQTADGEKSFRARTDKTKRHTGDPQFLKIVQWCIEQRIAIYGLKAPTTHKVHIDPLKEELLIHLQQGTITIEEIKEELGESLAMELFASAQPD